MAASLTLLQITSVDLMHPGSSSNALASMSTPRGLPLRVSGGAARAGMLPFLTLSDSRVLTNGLRSRAITRIRME